MNMPVDNLPPSLREHGLFCCWRYVERDGKLTKAPYNPRTGGGAQSTNPDTFSPLGVALEAAQRGGYDGVGVGIFGDLGAIDIDHCLDGNGELSPMAFDIMDTMQSYTEVSPSGKGLRILFKASGFQYDKAKYYINNQGAGLEVYISGATNKYVTVTGNAWTPGLELEERGKELAAVLEKYMVRQKPTPPPAADLDDLDLIERAKRSRGGAAFADLWAGNIAGYKSHSEADIALCNALAWWTNGDPRRVDKLFRQSGLYREDKWNRPQSGSTYGAITIQNAVNTCRGGYDPVGHCLNWDDHIGGNQANGTGESPGGFAPFSPFTPPDTTKLPAFPVDCLPPVLRDMAVAIAENLQVAVDMPALAELAVAALCIHGKFIINPKPGWVEPLNLYAVTVARPSDRKSPTLRACAKHVYSYVTEENFRRKPLVDEYNMKCTVLKKRINSMMEEAARPTRKGRTPVNPLDITELQYQLADLEREKVTPLRLIADDVTPEALVSLMAENGGKMAVVSSEGGIFDIAAGRYNDRANMDVFLKAYSGDPIQIDRKGRASESIDHATLTMLLTVQPSVLESIMGNAEFSGRGFLARFLYSLPASPVGHRRFDTAPVPANVERAYDYMLDSLLDIKDSGNPGVIKLAAEAYEESRRFFEALEPRLSGDLDEIEEWAGKYHGQVMRIAGILHCCQHGREAAQIPVILDTIQRAQRIGAYFLSHAQAAFRVMGLSEPKAEKDAKYILKRLQTVGKNEISKRDLFQLCRGHFQGADEMEPGIRELMERGYIAIETIRTGGRGRPTEMIKINPAAA